MVLHNSRKVMIRNEFTALRDLPNKLILGDIEFLPSKRNPRSQIADTIKIDNSLGYDLLLYGTYKPDIPTLTLNFVIRGVGPICRFDINGTIHGSAGRTHKHSLQNDTCPSLNLPTAKERLDFDINKQTIENIWSQVCSEANLVHHGVIRVK
jgi:hypothetical protein